MRDSTVMVHQQFLKLSRENKQGDPLSLHLFILVFEIVLFKSEMTHLLKVSK